MWLRAKGEIDEGIVGTYRGMFARASRPAVVPRPPGSSATVAVPVR